MKAEITNVIYGSVDSGIIMMAGLGVKLCLEHPGVKGNYEDQDLGF